MTLDSPGRGQKRKRQQEHTQMDLESSPAPEAIAHSSGPKPPKLKKSLKMVEEPDSSSEDKEEDDARLEDNYLHQRTSQKVVAEEYVGSVHESSGEDEEDAGPPAHETHTGATTTKTRIKSRKKTKYVPPDETPAQRDARTIFVGNIPIDVAKSKSSQKQLKRHFLSLVPGSKIESVRFRSVAFATATSELPVSEDPKPARGNKVGTPSTKQQRQQQRAAQWRDNEDDSAKSMNKRPRGHDDETSDREDEHGKSKKPSYLNPAEKKRVAFIRREFHQEVDTVNAYVVFAHAPLGSVTKETSALHPSEAARLAVEHCDGTTCLDRTIRVDRVGQWRQGSDAGAEGVAGEKGDPRKTLFVGNLDFAAKEEELRVWFEGVVSQERGPPGADEGSESDDEEYVGNATGKQKAWVKSVRIVRDRDTQLGKGFAYVRFADRDCVDEILGLEPDKLKFAKRKLRVQRCKVVPPGGAIAPSKSKSASTSKESTAATTKVVHAKKAPAVPVPRGDPALGAKLAGLSKDERKAAKASNVDRVKRRLAKKKVKAEVDKAREKSGGKVRDRERKQGGKREKGKVVNKGRIRSEKSVEKRNMKK